MREIVTENQRHMCRYQGEWPMCVVCEGRIHLPGCTSRRNRLKDCCPARHKMLFDQGHTRGLDDSSYVMWSPEHPGGYHPNDIRKIDKEPQ